MRDAGFDERARPDVAAAKVAERRLLAVVNGVKAVLPARGRWRAEPVDVLPLNVGQREGWRLLGDDVRLCGECALWDMFFE